MKSMHRNRMRLRLLAALAALPFVLPSCGSPPPYNPIASCVGLTLLIIAGAAIHWLLKNDLLNGGHVVAYLIPLVFGFLGLWNEGVLAGYAVFFVATWVLLEHSKNESLRRFGSEVGAPFASAVLSVVFYLGATYFLKLVLLLLRGRVPWQ